VDTFFSACIALLFTTCSCDLASHITTSPSGHWVEYEGRTLMLVGDSGTQCVLQNANLNYRAWIDDCAERGIPMIHVWSFMAPRQKSDGSELEERWKYVYPGLTPWRRHSGGQPAHDQLPRWNLQLFDDGADGALDHYWPRARDLCAYARSKKILVGYTVFTGWIKGNANAWAYHPFNKVNGGHLDRNLPDGVTIATPGQEIWNKDWQEDWSTAEKTQWIWERFALKAIEELNPFGNVFFVFFDEHSYTEGNMGDHFLQFFKKRNALWMDWAPRRQQVDFVLNDTNDRPDKNSLSVAGFFAKPARPYFLLEGGPYRGADVRTSMWTFAMGGGHYSYHGDTEQETPQTGIVGYDPLVPGGDKGMERRDWLGHMSRFFNDRIVNLDRMAPHNELVSEGVFCMAAPGQEYALYFTSDSPRNTSLKLPSGSIEATVTFCNPRTGKESAPVAVAVEQELQVSAPDEQDWAVHVLCR